MIINLAHKIELDPTVAQAIYFAKACGVARFTYNWALAEWKKQYQEGKKPRESELAKQLNSIKAIEFPWMLEVTKTAPQHAILNLGSAYKRFFKKQGKYPRFKKKGNRDSFRADDGPKGKYSDAVKIVGKEITLPRIGRVRMKQKLRFGNGRIISVTVSRTAHKWFASITVEVEHTKPIRENQAVVGVDLGIKSLVVLSDGTVFENPKALMSNLNKLKRLSRSLSRKQKGSANRKKARMKLARLHYRISCIRKDALHKVTTFLTKKYTLIGIEDLNVSGMVKNRKLARAISDIGFGEFRRQLTYKSELYGSNLFVADRWFPSSKTCSSCDAVKETLELSERSWICACGAEHNRDVNAAINLKMLAESSSVSACGADVSLGLTTEQTTTKQEIGNIYVDSIIRSC
jgi:putative transposase